MKTTTPIRYAGGKSKGLKFIIPYLENNDKIISPFMGGGSVEVYLASQGKQVIGFDIFSTLVNFWNVLLKHPKELGEKMKQINPTKEEYIKIKEILIQLNSTQKILNSWKTDYYKRDNPIEIDNITYAAYYYFNHNCSYGPGYLGWGSSVYLNDSKWNKMIETISNFNLPNLEVFEDSFENVIPKYNIDMLYIDPPYFLGDDKDNKMFKGIYPTRNIPIHHDGFNHEKLRDLLLQHKGKFVLCYNNCETIREWYKDFKFEFPSWNYSMGNGEKRIGKNRNERNKITKESHEILILNI